MSAERLREILNNVADETRPVPLEAAAMAESRRMGVRRTVVGAAAVALLLVAGVVGATSVWSDRGGEGVDPAVSESPVPSDSPGSGHLKDTKLWYIADDALHVLIDNEVTERVVENEPNLSATANVSPDGRYVSWVSSEGKLKIHDTTSGEQRELAYSGDASCQEPVWSVDSYELLVEDGGRLGFINVETAAFTPLPFDLDACHVQLDERPGTGDPAIERQYMYVDTAADKLIHVDDQGEQIGERSTIFGPGLEVYGVKARADGEYYCFATTLSIPGGETARLPGCDTVGSLGEDAIEPLPVGFATVDAVSTNADGELVVRLTRDSGETMGFYAFDENGAQLWAEEELSGLVGWDLLGWR